MDNVIKQITNDNSGNLVNLNKFLSLVLIVLIIFSLLGINILNMLGEFLESVVNIFSPLITRIVSIFAFTLGVLIEQIAKLFTTTATAGVEITGGTLDSVGDLLKDASRPSLQQTLNQSKKIEIPEIKKDNTESPIQKPITSSKKQWCLVGEYKGRRGCAEIKEGEKCLSGQVFLSKQTCMTSKQVPIQQTNVSVQKDHPLKTRQV